MTLSGYLFAKLLDHRKVLWLPFRWNRVLRLAPLLSVVIVVVALLRYVEGRWIDGYWTSILEGFVFPTWPNGGWSIAVEIQFYLLLPMILFLKSAFKPTLWLVLLAMVAFRAWIFVEQGDVQFAAYFTIIGRIDQFLLGILAFHYRARFARSHVLAAGVALSFAGFWWAFHSSGGFYRMPGHQPPTRLWVVIPTIEGAAYGALIAWYDNSFAFKASRVSRFIASIGTYSYSIYLWHFFIVFRMARFVDRTVIGLTDPVVTILIAIPCLLLMLPACFLSYKFIESPFLAHRLRYVQPRNDGDREGHNA